MTDHTNKDPSEHKPGGFGLPEGYFQSSARAVLNKIEWEDEHKGYPLLKNSKKEPGYILPLNYFGKKERSLELLAYPQLSLAGNDPGFTLPVDYFSSFVNKTVAVITENGTELSDLKNLTSIKKENPFDVDGNYFTVNAVRLRTLLRNNNPVFIDLFKPGKTVYAMAALLMIALGIWTYGHFFNTDQDKDCGTMACIDKADLVKAKNIENMDNEELYELVDPDALQKKLEKRKLNDTHKPDTAEDILELPDEI